MTQLGDENAPWRALLQLAQATYTAFEREIPEAEGVPAHGLALLRLLRWHGPKTMSAIAAYLNLPADGVVALIDEMHGAGFVRVQDTSEAGGDLVYELDSRGAQVSRQIIITQRSRIEELMRGVSEDELGALVRTLEKVAFGLVSECRGGGMTCAACWAFDTRECLSRGVQEACMFHQAGYTQLDPSSEERADEAPSNFVPTMPRRCDTEFGQ